MNKARTSLRSRLVGTMVGVFLLFWLGTIVAVIATHYLAAPGVRTLVADNVGTGGQLDTVMSALDARSEDDLRRTLGVVAVTLTVLMLLGLALLQRMTSRITRPLERLAMAAREASEGKRVAPVRVDTGDELQVLADAFNAMRRGNERAFERLQDERANALDEAQLKSEFLANMSHEIRTSMNGIVGVNKIMLGMPLDPKLRRYAETVDASACALLTIVNDILDFSKIEAGKYDIRPVVFDPRLLLQEIVELLAPRAHAKKLELVQRVAPELPAMIETDPDRLRQVLTNLLGNAIKYTEQGEVYVHVTSRDKQEDHCTMRVEVHDTGPGIPASERASLFDAFSRGDGEHMSGVAGTGLGLSISKRIVELMGGEIGVESQPGEGSVFWFSLGVQLVDPASLRPTSMEPIGRRALIIEDNARWRTVLQEHLDAWELTHDSARSLAGAIGLLEVASTDGQPFDVVLVGSVRDATTDEIIHAVRRDNARAATPIIALSQMGSVVTASELDAEITAQLQKPLRLSDLYDTLVGVFRGAEPIPRAAPTPAIHVAAPEGLRVLVVEDNPINQFVAKEQLEQFGYAVTLADHGQQGVDLVSREHFDAVLMDCQMPVLDGYAATREIRRREAGGDRHVPIIALTAHALAGERDRVLDAGMDDYLTKPIREQSLRKALQRHAGLPDRQPAPQATTEPPRLDPEVARSAAIIGVVLAALPGQLSALADALAGGGTGAVQAAARKLKGSCASVGAPRMAAMAARVEASAASDMEGRLLSELGRLEAECDAVCAALGQEQAQQRPPLVGAG